MIFWLLSSFLGLGSSETCTDQIECNIDRFCCELDTEKYTCCPDPSTYEFPCYISNEDLEDFLYGFFTKELMIPVTYTSISECLNSTNMTYTSAYLCGAYRDLKDKEYSLIAYGLYNLAMFSHNLISALNTCKPEYTILVALLSDGIDGIVNSNYIFELDMINTSFKINGIELYYNVFGDPNDGSIFGFVDAWEHGYLMRAGQDISIIIRKIADWSRVSKTFEAFNTVDPRAYTSDNSVISKNEEETFVDVASGDKDECDSKLYNQNFLEYVVSGVLVVFDFEYDYNDIKNCLSEEDEKQIFEWSCYTYKETACLLYDSCHYNSYSKLARDMTSYSALLTELVTVALLSCKNTPPVLALAIQNGITHQYSYFRFDIDISEHEIEMSDTNIYPTANSSDYYYEKNYPYNFGQMLSRYTFTNIEWEEVLDIFDPDRNATLTYLIREIEFISKNDDIGFVASVQFVSEFLIELEVFQNETMFRCAGDFANTGHHLRMAKDFASSLSNQIDSANKTISLMNNMFEALVEPLGLIYACNEDSSIKRIKDAVFAVLDEELITMDGNDILLNSIDVTANVTDLVKSFNEDRYTTVGYDFARIYSASLDSSSFEFSLHLVSLGLVLLLIAN